MDINEKKKPFVLLLPHVKFNKEYLKEILD